VGATPRQDKKEGHTETPSACADAKYSTVVAMTLDPDFDPVQSVLDVIVSRSSEQREQISILSLYETNISRLR
jgi:hypothetical protein